MPSTPRLRTPDFSVTSSPTPANISGIAAVTALEVSALACWISIRPGRGKSVGLRCNGTAAHAGIHKQVSAQQAEQQQPLEHAGERLRQLHRGLHRFAAEVQQRHQETRQYDAN